MRDGNPLREKIGYILDSLEDYTDTLDDDEAPSEVHPAGAFVTTTIAFFIAEMGDKTQFATIALAAKYDALLWVVLGTTIGMMIANVPAVLLGEGLARRLPLTQIRWIAAAVFVLTGVLTIAHAGSL